MLVHATIQSAWAIRTEQPACSLLLQFSSAYVCRAHTENFVVAASPVGASRPAGLCGLTPRRKPAFPSSSSQYRRRLDQAQGFRKDILTSIVPDLVEVLFEVPCGGFLPGLIVSVPLGKCPVPHKACDSCRASAHTALVLRSDGVESSGRESYVPCLFWVMIFWPWYRTEFLASQASKNRVNTPTFDPFFLPFLKLFRAHCSPRATTLRRRSNRSKV